MFRAKGHKQKSPSEEGRRSTHDAELAQHLDDQEDGCTHGSQEANSGDAIGLSSGDRRGNAFGQGSVSRRGQVQDASGSEAAHDVLVHLKDSVVRVEKAPWMHQTKGQGIRGRDEREGG